MSSALSTVHTRLYGILPMLALIAIAMRLGHGINKQDTSITNDTVERTNDSGENCDIQIQTAKNNTIQNNSIKRKLFAWNFP